MGIDGQGRLTEPDIEDDVGGFSSDAWQLHELFAGIGHFAMEVVNQFSAESEDMFGLDSVEAEGMDGLFQFFLSQVEVILGAAHGFPEFGGCLVDGLVGALGGKDDCHEEVECRLELKFRLRGDGARQCLEATV